jgi:hypothetical protein
MIKTLYTSTPPVKGGVYLHSLTPPTPSGQSKAAPSCSHPIYIPIKVRSVFEKEAPNLFIRQAPYVGYGALFFQKKN